MEFGITKCAVILLLREWKLWWEGKDLPNGKEITETNGGNEKQKKRSISIRGEYLYRYLYRQKSS